MEPQPVSVPRKGANHDSNPPDRPRRGPPRARGLHDRRQQHADGLGRRDRCDGRGRRIRRGGSGHDLVRRARGLRGERVGLSLAKRHFRAGNYALAEQEFRRAAEAAPRDVGAWLGLAASSDRLKRFEAADRAYGQAVRLAGATPEILNNQGYSYMLRGDFKRAHRALLAARTLDPKNPHVQANLELLQGSAHLARAGL